MTVLPTKVDGDRLYATDLNRVFAVDTASTTMNEETSYTVLKAVTVPAAEVSEFVMINTLLYYKLYVESAENAGYSLDIRVGDISSTSLDSSDSIQEFTNFCYTSSQSSGGYDNDWSTTTISWFFQPSSGQKTSGFRIEILGKYGGSTSGNHYLTAYQTITSGV